jgi:acyl-CoA reductase-like NAD-dependent aldehyde dehydrogenase
VILGPDAAEDWRRHLDLVASSVAANGGRSCINASGVWTPSQGHRIAEALAEKLASIVARPLDDPAAELAAFPDPEIARRISDLVDSQLAAGGAEDLTAKYREGSRVAEAGGCTFLLPTVVWCESPEHPLAQAEYVFPFVSVVEVPDLELWDRLGPTLVGTVISEDRFFVNRALTSRAIDRLNLGAVPTYQISWDQPHEGNLFDHLYQQRAFQRVA